MEAIIVALLSALISAVVASERMRQQRDAAQRSAAKWHQRYRSAEARAKKAEARWIRERLGGAPAKSELRARRRSLKSIVEDKSGG